MSPTQPRPATSSRTQIKQYEVRLTEAENRLAEFKTKNMGLIQGEGDFYGRFEAARAEVSALQSQVSSLTNKRNELARQLAGESSGTDGIDPLRSSSVDGPISNLEAEIAQLQLRFTDKHPDVLRATQTLDDLYKIREEELRARAAGGPDSSRRSVDLVSQRIKIALSTTDADLAALRSQLSQKNAEVAYLRGMANTIPEVEAQLVRLNRDYTVVKTEYETLLQRLESARMNQEVQADKKDVTFKVLDPPRTPLATEQPGPLSPEHPGASGCTGRRPAGDLPARPAGSDLLFHGTPQRGRRRARLRHGQHRRQSGQQLQQRTGASRLQQARCCWPISRYCSSTGSLSHDHHRTRHSGCPGQGRNRQLPTEPDKDIRTQFRPRHALPRPTHEAPDQVVAFPRLDTGGSLVTEIADPKVYEQFRRLKRPLLQCAFGPLATPGTQTIMITSPLQGAGKTFVSSNLAYALALEKDRNVLLIDTDNANPTLTRQMGLTGRPGLYDLISDTATDAGRGGMRDRYSGALGTAGRQDRNGLTRTAEQPSLPGDIPSTG